ncbi:MULTISPECIES: hypothetical protein [Haloferacaceae]|uniref:Uncharacterized protein n=2 Tax=Haloferacaceae TaxID=1644056 RepID=A0ABD6DD46_9EURY|nr:MULTISPECIES: hypothetical protein [Halorubraceae]
MATPNYIIVPKEDGSYVVGGRAYPTEGTIGATILRELTDIPERIANISGFEPDEYVFYFDGPSEGYINPSSVETVINVETLLEEELNKLDKSIEHP